MTDTKIQVVLAEDNTIVRKGIRRLLNRAQDIEVVGEASNGADAVKLVEEAQPDILLLDVEMPVMDGIEVARLLKENEAGRTHILVLSAYDDKEYIQEMLFHGASGYLLKDEAPERIIEAIQGIAQGETGWVSPQVEDILRKKRRKRPAA